MNSYDLSRQFFDWSFENPEKITPTHVAMYFFIIEHCNRLGWKEKFGLPTTMVKEAIGIRNFRTYINTLNDLVEWGFVTMIEKSKNQHSSNIVAIVNFTKADADADTKALDKALQKHSQKQSKSIDSINKQRTIEQRTIEQETNICLLFEDFWKKYPNKQGKETARKKFDKLLEQDKILIKETLDKFINNIPFVGYNYPMATTYLNQKRWLDYVTASKNTNEGVFVDFEKLTDDGYGRKLSVGGCYRKLEEFMLASNNPEIRKACLPKLIEYGEEHKNCVPEISWHETFKKYKQEALLS